MFWETRAQAEAVEVRTRKWRLGDDSMVKGTGYSRRDPGSVPSTPMMGNSTSTGSNTVFWPPWALYTRCTYMLAGKTRIHVE